MQTSSKIVSILLVVLMSAGSCQKEEDIEVAASEVTDCDAKRKTVKVVKESEGQIWFNSAIQKYAIYASVAGTYDMQYVGVSCELPEEFKMEGLQVVFSGTYMDYGPQLAGVVAGQTYYYLKLSDIEENI